MHPHVGNVAEGDLYKEVAEPFLEQQQPAEESELLEDPTQGSEEPKATEEGKHRSMNQFLKI